MNRGICLAVLLLLMALTTPTAVIEGGGPACPVCGTAFELVADHHGDMSVKHSSVTIHVAEDGDSTWVGLTTVSTPPNPLAIAMFALPVGLSFSFGAARNRKERIGTLLLAVVAFCLAFALMLDIAGLIFGAVVIVTGLSAVLPSVLAFPLVVAGQTASAR